MLFWKQSLMTVCLSLMGIVSSTTAIPNANNFLTDHQKEEAANASSRVNTSPLRTNRKLRRSGKSGKSGENDVPAPSECSDFDIDSILLIIANADILTLSNDIVQQEALETFIIDEYNELASEECGEGVRFLTSADINFGTNALANPMSRALHQSSSRNNHHGRRLTATRPDPKVSLASNTRGRCNRCRRRTAIRPDTSNRYLTFLEGMETTTTSNMHASSSNHLHQRQTAEGKKRGERSGQVADTAIFGKSGKKQSSKSSVAVTQTDSAASGKKSSSKSPSGKTTSSGKKGEDSLKGKKGDAAATEPDKKGKKGSNSEGSMKGKKGDSTASAPSGATSGKKSSKSPNGKKGYDSLKGKKKSSNSASDQGSMKSVNGDSTASAPGTAPSDKGSMDKASNDYTPESSSSPAPPIPLSSGKSGKKGNKSPDPEPEECCEPPTDIQLTAALSEALQEDPDVVPSVSNVDSIIELSPIDCNDEVTTLHGIVTIEHEASQLKDHELDHLAEAFIDAYNQANSLNIDTCDPSFRAVTDCTVHVPSSYGRYLNSESETSSVVLEYHYTATCRGCPVGSKIFEPIVERRSLEKYGGALSSHEKAPVFAGDHRHLAEIIQANCFCPPVVESESRGPTKSEFFDIFADLFDFLRFEDKILHIETVGTITEH